jgi:hypothetical protein
MAPSGQALEWITATERKPLLQHPSLVPLGIAWGFVLVGVIVLIGCATEARQRPATIDECFSERSLAIQRKAPLECLATLDGDCVPLAPIFERCAALWPDCVLFPKFYYWPSKVEERISETPTGPVAHKVRLYFNLRSACDPDYVDPGQTHGDVAEFYDAEGAFMGLAVYMGDGRYAPLPYAP